MTYCYLVPLFSAPTPPRNLQLSVLSSTSIRVSWQEPLKENGIIRKYVVSYGKATDFLDMSVNTATTTYDLTDLEEFTEYFVRVHAETSVSGNPSDIEHATTLEDGEFFAVYLFTYLFLCLIIYVFFYHGNSKCNQVHY